MKFMQNSSNNKKLLFVCGFPSGGTDLTKTILNVHPDIYVNGEMPFLKNLVQAGYNKFTRFTNIADINYLQNILKNTDPWKNIENIDYDFTSDIAKKKVLSLEEVIRVFFSNLERKVWGNKTPQNTESIESLLKLFKKPYFIIVTRDIRDVCMSWHNKWGKDMIWCSAKWAERMKKGYDITQNIASKQYLFIKYEDILSNTEGICRKICQFLELPFSERMLEHHKYTVRKIDGKINYGQIIIADNKRKWEGQLPNKTIERIEEIAFQTMKNLGYKPDFAYKERAITSTEIWYGKLKDLMAFFFIGNRYSKENHLQRIFKNLKMVLLKYV
jgi:hypothetical protein